MLASSLNESHELNTTAFDINSFVSDHNLDTKNKVSIIAGHYCVADELQDLSSDGESEENSFLFGCNLSSHLKNIGVDSKLILFINDIGVTSESRKNIIDDFKIPENYQKIISENNLTDSQIEIVFESAIRNRASKEVRKIKKKQEGIFEILSSTDKRLVRCIDPAAMCEIPSENKDAITIKGPDGEYLVVKEGSNPKCNTILATLFNNLENAGSDSIINCFNVIYVNRIRLGGFVSDNLFKNKCEKINVYFDENGIA